MNNEIKLLITGDFCPVNRVNNLAISGDYITVFNDLLPIIRRSDLSITNLECPLTTTQKRIVKTGPHLKAERSAAKMIADAGFKLVTLANNHILDYGLDGLKSTIQACEEHSIHFVGAGLDYISARAVKYLQIKEYVVAILNFAENEFSTSNDKNPGANPFNPFDNYYDIQEAKKNADLVIVLFHGGHEMFNLPSPRIKKTFRFYADAGADVILSHHTHCYSGYEIYGGVPIFYGLGNFIFDKKSKINSEWNYGYAVEVIFNKVTINYNLIPYEQCNDRAGVSLLTNNIPFEKNIEHLNSIIKDDELLHYEFQQYCVRVKKMYFSYLEPHSISFIRYLQNRAILPSILSKSKRNLYLNLIRCESHRDVIIELLGNLNS